ncbi:MAG: HAMP domain-containing histidine kinase, partial [Myxococcales bacterium]|nr:HAMP domain-containing histidine kinase [Myxococcales bacterium]
KPLDQVIEEAAMKIIDRYVDEVRAHDLPPRPLTREEVIDHLLAYIIDLVGALRGNRDAVYRSAGIAAEHGRQRWYVGYDLKTIVLEYGVLRRAILAEVEATGGVVGAREFEDVVAFLTIGIAGAVAEFGKKNTEALEAALATAKRATDAREDVLAIVSHDLRSPLQVIRGSSELIEEDAGENRLADVAVSVGRIRRACVKMESLIGSILALARLKSGEVMLELAPHPARSLLAEAIEQALPLAEAKGVRLLVERVDEGPVECDAERLLQVLANLVSNAIKFTKPGGTVNVSARAEPEAWFFSVEDVGQGIAPSKVDQIFDRFWHGGEKNSGTGLGLSIAKGLVELHQGRIWVDTRLGVGSTFFFTIPRRS